MSKLKQLRLRCFFDISIAEDNIGRIIFELFNDVCPKTCENFKALCTGENGTGKFTGKPLHYKNIIFHRVVRNFMIQSGDFSQGNGKGGESIYGGTFPDESFDFKHDKPFLLSMANRGKNTNGSQFFITLVPTPHLDGVHVVFGHVISGQDVIMKIANQAVDKNNKPLVEVRISNCGELIPQIKSKDKKKGKALDEKSGSSSSGDEDSDSSNSSSSNSSDEDSNSDREDGRRHSRNKNENEERNSPVNDTNGKNIAIPINNLPNAPKIYANIKADEIPEVPPNRFLSRGYKPKLQNDDGEPRDTRRESVRESYSRKYTYSKSGRKIKGRGFIRFRTPSPRNNRHRRSETPPHWRSEQSKTRTFKEIVSNSTKDKQDRLSNRSRDDERTRRSNRRSDRSRSRSSDRYRKRSSRHETSPKRKDRSNRSRSRSPKRESKTNRNHSTDSIDNQTSSSDNHRPLNGKYNKEKSNHHRNDSTDNKDIERRQLYSTKEKVSSVCE
ncbi:anaphase promoting complex subunit cdc16 [Blomia tropicalis]|nr:anaphase promoting complex subunit cdc16 [Blomia tropicalis]